MVRGQKIIIIIIISFAPEELSTLERTIGQKMTMPGMRAFDGAPAIIFSSSILAAFRIFYCCSRQILIFQLSFRILGVFFQT
jgi:hypothetical protein